MPRTAEHIVACHQHATALRRAGKPIWSYKINLHGILDSANEDHTPEQITEIAKKVAKELRRLPAKFFDQSDDECDFDFVNAVEELEQMTPESLAAEAKTFHEEPVGILDGWLGEIYDWCDRNRVWTRGS